MTTTIVTVMSIAIVSIELRWRKMVDVNPEIWENKTLGAAAHNERLDRLEKQQHEDRAAKLEGREPREVVVDNTYPGFQFDQNSAVPSNAVVVHFADEQPHEVVQTGENVKPEGMSDEDWAPADSETATPAEDPDESESTVAHSPEEEGSSTQWT